MADNMAEPSKAANRILLGTGFGLILICGFAIIEERMVVTEIGFGHLFLLIGIICLVMSKLLDYEASFLSNIFPNENRVGNAWAELESKVLTDEIDLEQE